jgi:ribosomal protein L4
MKDLSGCAQCQCASARAGELNTEQLLAFDKVILTRDALATLSERLAS